MIDSLVKGGSAVLRWFNPTRWAILAGGVAVFVALQTGFYFWAVNEGENQNELKHAQAETRRARDITKLEKDRNANQQAAVQLATELQTAEGKLHAADVQKARAILAARDAQRELARRMQEQPGGTVDPGLPDVGSVADDRTDLLAIAGDAIATANENANIANGAFAAIERDCRLWQERWGKDATICGTGAAEKRYASRRAEVAARVAEINDRKDALLGRTREPK